MKKKRNQSCCIKSFVYGNWNLKRKMKEEKKRKTSVKLLIVSVKKRSFTLKLSLYMEMIVDCMLQM